MTITLTELAKYSSISWELNWFSLKYYFQDIDYQSVRILFDY